MALLGARSLTVEETGTSLEEGQGEFCELDSDSQICLLKELWDQGRPNGPKHS